MVEADPQVGVHLAQVGALKWEHSIWLSPLASMYRSAWLVVLILAEESCHTDTHMPLCCSVVTVALDGIMA